MTPDPALLAALAAAPGIKPRLSLPGATFIWTGRMVPRQTSCLDQLTWWLGSPDSVWACPFDLKLIAILDPRDAEIARLRARIAELEAGR